MSNQINKGLDTERATYELFDKIMKFLRESDQFKDKLFELEIFHTTISQFNMLNLQLLFGGLLDVHVKNQWKAYVEDNWKFLKENIDALPKREDLEDEDWDFYIYMRFDRETFELSYSDLTNSQYWHGESQSEYVINNFMIDGSTTKEELLDWDLSDTLLEQLEY